ncbi:MAG: hypothetical protein M1840_001286 [Geoglossum simile]|nr:MAG: hypothetical protein M1840_001286 [Geoglossum simile]
MLSTQAPLQRERLNSPLRDLDSTKAFLVGVAIFRPSPDPDSSGKYQLLVVKRAESEDTFPNNWEIPGGHVDESDLSVRHTVERETLEETSLVVDGVLGEFDELFWDSRKGKKNVQFNYVVTVKEFTEIKLNADEHSEWMWVNKGGIDDLLMTPAMNKVLKDAFEFSEKYMAP